MGKLHKIRKAFNALTDKQKGHLYYSGASVSNGKVEWHSGVSHKNFIKKLRGNCSVARARGCKPRDESLSVVRVHLTPPCAGSLIGNGD